MEPDPLIDRPAWLPRWFSVDDVRTMRWLRRALIAVFVAALAACVSEGANAPADPELDVESTETTRSEDATGSTGTTRSTETTASGGSTGSSGSTEPGGSPVPSDPADDPTGSTVAPGPADESTTTRRSTTSADASTTSAPSELAERFGTIVVELVTASGDILELCLLDADEPAERRQGLREVTDLEGHDGMLFRWEEPTQSDFVMADTVTPLTISWWEGDGTFVSSTDMEPCTEDDSRDCPRYSAGGPYRYAVEVFQGELPEATAGARLDPRVGSSCQRA